MTAFILAVVLGAAPEATTPFLKPLVTRHWSIGGERVYGTLAEFNRSAVWFRVSGELVRVARKELTPADRRAVAFQERRVRLAASPIKSKAVEPQPKQKPC